MAIGIDVNRPRNVDWKRAAALLYGDWGTSKAYVLGLAFAGTAFASLPLVIAVCVLTGLVGLNYASICKYFPDGGGVYSAAKSQGRLLAVVGALLLVADLTVTAALSCWEGLVYFGLPQMYIPYVAIAVVVVLGFLNSYGPKHSGSLAVVLAIPTVLVVLYLIGMAAPHLTTKNLEAPHISASHLWVSFTGVILALSGVEAIANLTGVLKLDPGSTSEHPKVTREAGKAIFVVALEVTVGTALLAWAMLSLPKELGPDMQNDFEHMLRFMAVKYGEMNFGPVFGFRSGIVVGAIIGALLLSAVNTAIAATIGLLYMLARDGEMPEAFSALNRHGVPKLPLAASVLLPSTVLLLTLPNPKDALHMLAGLYAIGVVGAIAVNVGSCAFNRALPVKWWDRAMFGVTFVILSAVELTLARTKPDALFFVVCVLGVGLALRAWSHKHAGLATVTVPIEVAEIVQPEALEKLRPRCVEGQKIMVAARGVTPVLRFALNEAALRKATLYVLYVREVAFFIGGTNPVPAKSTRPKWQEDPQASAIMSLCLKAGEEYGVPVMPVYVVSTNPAGTIIDISATLGVDILMLGSAHRTTMARLLKGDVVTQVATGLPEEIELVIHG
jgi:amino acid transporter/nucleotide-binding universal stress UspA family protein